MLLYVITTECNYFSLPDNTNPVIESFMTDVYCAARNTQGQVNYYLVIINYCQLCKKTDIHHNVFCLDC